MVFNADTAAKSFEPIEVLLDGKTYAVPEPLTRQMIEKADAQFDILKQKDFDGKDPSNVFARRLEIYCGIPVRAWEGHDIRVLMAAEDYVRGEINKQLTGGGMDPQKGKAATKPRR